MSPAALAVAPAKGPTSAHSNSQGNLPTFLLIGAQKSATTSVFRLLQNATVSVKAKQEPLICGRADGDAQVKEAHFFDAAADLFEKSEALPSYRRFFTTDNGCSRWMDATASYLYDRDSAARMLEVMPSPWMKTVKMIAILREPVARDLSMYNLAKADWSKHKSSDVTVVGHISAQFCGAPIARAKGKWNATAEIQFPTYAQSVACRVRDWHTRCLVAGKGDLKQAALACSYHSSKEHSAKPQKSFNRLTIGMYAQQVSRYHSIFSRDRVMVLNFDSLTFDGEQADYIKRIAAFLALPETKTLGRQLPHEHGEDFEGKVAIPDCKSRDTLHQVYAPFNTELVEQLAASRDDASPHEPGFADFHKAECGEPPSPPPEPPERVRRKQTGGQRTLVLQNTRWSRP